MNDYETPSAICSAEPIDHTFGTEQQGAITRAVNARRERFAR